MEPFYDGQIERYLLQFERLFSSFSVQDGIDRETGEMKYRRVPAIYGDMPRHAAHIIRNNSENMIESIPQMSFYITSMEPLESMRRAPHYQDVVQVTERRFNELTQRYEEGAGASYSVTRYQPVPYVMTLNLDLWTSVNAPIQKFQLWEQLTSLFNPSVDLMTNTSPFDWTALTYCELRSTTWTERSIPASGTDDVIDIARFGFWMPIYMNPPMRIQKQNIVKSIIASMHTSPQENTIPDAVDAEIDLTENAPDRRLVYLVAAGGAMAGLEEDANLGDIVKWKWDEGKKGKRKKTGAWTKIFDSKSAQRLQDQYASWVPKPDFQLRWDSKRRAWSMVPVIDTVNWTARDADGNLREPDAGATIVNPHEFRIRIWQAGTGRHYIHLFDEGEDSEWVKEDGSVEFGNYRENTIPRPVDAVVNLTHANLDSLDRDKVYLLTGGLPSSDTDELKDRIYKGFRWIGSEVPAKDDIIAFDESGNGWEILFDASAADGSQSVSYSPNPDRQLQWKPDEWKLVHTPADWETEIFGKHGELRPEVTQLRLRNNMNSQEVYGTVKWHTTSGEDAVAVTRLLEVELEKDTFMPDSIDSVDAFVDPQSDAGRRVLKLSDKADRAGKRYILLNDMIVDNDDVIPKIPGTRKYDRSGIPAKNDIIEWDAAKDEWVRIKEFESAKMKEDRYVTVNYASVSAMIAGERMTQAQWHWTGSAGKSANRIWQHSVLGVYRPGFWRLAI